MRTRLFFLVGLGLGYVLGTRRGRQGYIEIRDRAQAILGNPKVQKAANTAKSVAEDKAPAATAKVEETIDKAQAKVEETIDIAQAKVDEASPRMAEEEGDRASSRAATAEAPDDPRKPDSPTELTKPSWSYVLRKTAREFTTDHCTDLAASLTYYATLAVFPALLAFVSILGLVGNAHKTTNSMLSLLGGVAPAGVLGSLRGVLDNLTHSPASGVTLAIGIVGAIWSASGFVNAFSRAMNRVYSIEEGRPIWKLRPVTLLVTVIALVVAVLAATLLAVSGPIAQQIGSMLGVGSAVLVAWDIIKWPILALLAILMVAVLYYATPNIKQPKFRWMSIGSLVALVVWALASVGFAFYAANFSKYNSTYGAIGGIIIFLLWIWISNNALLFGAELDAELERGRELQAGMEAEETIQLPPRDTRQSDKRAKKHSEDVRIGRELRLSRGRSDKPSSSSS